MKLITAHEALCTSCGICADVCPMDIIVLTPDGFPGPGARAELLCINCAYCVDVCPTGALVHRYRQRRTDAGAAARREKLQKMIKREGAS